MEKIVFRHQEIETLPLPQLKELQRQKLQKTVEAALKTPFYKKRLNDAGIRDARDIQTEADFRKIPYTTKHDLREAFPYGMLAADKADVVRMHASSGTTGIPTVVYLTQADLDKAAELNARSCACTGSTKNDVFQNMMTYGLFTGGLMLHYGAERLGMMVIPSGSGNTKRQLQLMKDFRTTVVHATPSYLLHMHDVMREEGFRPGDFALKKAYIGAEPHSEDIRKKIEMLYGIDAYNSYGLSEMNGPGLAFECVYKNGMHLWEDSYIGEIIDPQTLEPLPDGERGELVLTILERNGMPILRYRTRDLTRFIPEPCLCGRTHRRLERMTGRSDDMLIINGVNVFPVANRRSDYENAGNRQQLSDSGSETGTAGQADGQGGSDRLSLFRRQPRFGAHPPPHSDGFTGGRLHPPGGGTPRTGRAAGQSGKSGAGH